MASIRFVTLFAYLSLLVAKKALQNVVGVEGFPVGPPGTAFFVKARAHALDKVSTAQEANSHFANQASRNAGNQALQQDLVFTKNNLNQDANDHGYQDAVAEKKQLRQYDTNQKADGAVFFGRRVLSDFDEDAEGCVSCGGYVDGPVPPSGFNNAKKVADAVNKVKFFNEANKERASDASSHASSKRIEKHDLNQEAFDDASVASKAGAHARAKGNFFSQRNAEQARGVSQNNGLFYRRLFRA